VIRGVVQDPHPATTGSAVAPEMPQEAAETEALKLRLRLSDPLPWAQVDSFTGLPTLGSAPGKGRGSSLAAPRRRSACHSEKVNLNMRHYL
jgi:hypothetical protein